MQEVATRTSGVWPRLRKMDCDIWVPTETHDDLSLGAEYRAVSTSQRAGRAGGRWASIWSRFPVVRAVEVADSDRTVAVLVASALGPLLHR